MRYCNETVEKANGAIYTPQLLSDYVASKMLEISTLPNDGTICILDPAVGKGTLLISIINKIVNKGLHIKAVGYETDKVVGEATSMRLKQLFPREQIEIRIGDFLEAVDNKAVETFDFVIANPPYIRTQIVGSNKAQKIAEKLGLSGKIDIYYAFLVLTNEVLKDTGIAGYITSNKFMTIKSGTAVRNYILQNYQLHHIVDFGDTKLFSAAILPCVLLFSRKNTGAKKEIQFTSIYQCVGEDISSIRTENIFNVIDKEGCFLVPDGRCFKIQQGSLRNNKDGSIWTISSIDNTKWLKKVEAHTLMTFSQIGKIRVGIKTTADNVFIGDNWEEKELDLELLKPLITHRDAGQIVSHRKSGWKVLYPYTAVNGKKAVVNIDMYPQTKRYLLSHYDQLASRDYIMKANRKWYEIWVPHSPEVWNHKKIVFRDISNKPEFWLDETGSVVNGDCYWIDIFPTVVDEVVFLALAIANSSFIEKYYDVKFNTKLYSGKRRFQTQYVAQFPIPYYGSPEAQQAIDIVKRIIAEGHQETFLRYKDQLDSLVDAMFT